ncbi:MAG: hypothetical protein EBY18_16635 [Alphaproteobacteria bacterium]|nr:hypothetical protein [Alphaproteobacteria bacterium]
MPAPPTARLRPLLQFQARLDDDVTPHRHFRANAPGLSLRPQRTDVETNTAQLVDDRRRQVSRVEQAKLSEYRGLPPIDVRAIGLAAAEALASIRFEKLNGLFGEPPGPAGRPASE